MLQINKTKATEELLKVYFFKIYERKKEFYDFDIVEKKLHSIIESKSFNEMNSRELFDCISINLYDEDGDSYYIDGQDLMPNYFYYLDNGIKTDDNNIFSSPFLYTSIELVAGLDLFKAKLDCKDEFGYDLLNDEGSIVMKLTPKIYNDKNLIIEVLETHNLFILKTNYGNTIKGTYSFINNHISQIIRIDSKALLLDLIKLGYGKFVEFASDNLKMDRDIFSAGIECDEFDFSFASDVIRNDKDLLLNAVSKHGHLLQYASSNLRNDNEVVLSALSNDGEALQYASEMLRKNKEIVLAAVSMNGISLKYTNDDLRNDIDVVLAAVKNDGLALKYVSDELKSNVTIVLAAVSKNGNAIKYVNDDLKNNKNIALKAITKTKNSFLYIGDDLKNDFDIISISKKNKSAN
jgi:hypothetical protein